MGIPDRSPDKEHRDAKNAHSGMTTLVRSGMIVAESPDKEHRDAKNAHSGMTTLVRSGMTRLWMGIPDKNIRE